MISLFLCLLTAPLFARSPYLPTFKNARVETCRTIGSTELNLWIFGGGPCKLVGYGGAEHGFFDRGEGYSKSVAEADSFLVDLGWIKT